MDVLDVLLVISDAEKSDQYETGTNNSMSTTSSEGVCAYLSKIMGTDRLANLASFEFASSAVDLGNSALNTRKSGTCGQSGRALVWYNNDDMGLLRLSAASTSSSSQPHVATVDAIHQDTGPSLIHSRIRNDNPELVTILLQHPLIIKHKDNFIISAWQLTFEWLADKAATGIDLNSRERRIPTGQEEGAADDKQEERRETAARLARPSLCHR